MAGSRTGIVGKLPWTTALPGDADDDDPRFRPSGGACRPDLEEVLLDAYRLLNLAIADPSIAAIADSAELAWERAGWESFVHPLDGMRHYRHQEVVRCLGVIAFGVRMYDDQVAILAAMKADVGVDIEDLKAPERRRKLSLRQACNRIIHSIEVHVPEFGPDAYHVHLRGRRAVREKGEVVWASIIDVVQFATHAARLHLR